MTESVLPSNPVELSSPSNEDYLVFYSLTGVTLARAASVEDAGRKVVGDLRSFIKEANRHGVGPVEATRIRLGDVDIKIDSVEAVIDLCQPSDEHEFPSTQVIGLPPLNDVTPSGEPQPALTSPLPAGANPHDA